MKIWIDDEREAPIGYSWIHSVNEAIAFIMRCEHNQKLFEPYGSMWKIEVIDIDHDAGIYADDGGDYIKVLEWMERTYRDYPIHLHTMNVIGRENMRAIIQHNNWKEV